MSEMEVSAGDTADLLARAYITLLAKAENVKIKSVLGAQATGDDLTSFLDDLEGEYIPDDQHLRVDLVMAAVLTAKAVAEEPSLARRLRREAPVVTIETHTAEVVSLVTTIVEDCACAGSKGRLIVARDGSDKGHNPERGNPDVIASMNMRKAVVGIAADVKRHLPSSLLRSAEYRLSIPPMDKWAVCLVIEAITGSKEVADLDDALLRAVQLEDLSLAIRAGMSPAECVTRIRKVIESKSTDLGKGPVLDDLHGYGEAMSWARDLVSDVLDYKAGRIAWDMVDTTGLLLAGPPGTGKTSFAGAVARTAGVPLIATSVAQWNASSYLSGTLQAIRNVFGEARRQAPCIILIDEVDGISSRATISGEYTEYWLQIVNCLLECLSGAVDNPGVMVIATTNFPDRIDPALRRAGRLDREIILTRPGTQDLCAIFRHHLGPHCLGAKDLMPLALAADGKTGADVEAYVRRAKGRARRADRAVTLEDVLDEVRQGRAHISGETRRRVAVHEAGHVVVGRELGVGNFLGVSLHDGGGQADFGDAIDLSATVDMIERLVCLYLAGRAAEALVLGNVAIGSGIGEQSDLARATALVELLETKASDSPHAVHLAGDFALNLSVIPGLLTAVSDRLGRAWQRAKEILEANRLTLDAISSRLEERGYLSPQNVEELMEGMDHNLMVGAAE